MSTDAREIIADALWRLDGIHVTPDGPDEYHRSNADALVTRLRSAGLLLPPGGETRTEHGYRYRAPGKVWTSVAVCDNADQAAAIAADVTATTYATGQHVRRTVYTGPWQPATTDEEGTDRG